jgi:hypothetical protein
MTNDFEQGGASLALSVQVETQADIDGEIARALHLVLPSLNDPKLAAMTIHMMLRRRGLSVVRVS